MKKNKIKNFLKTAVYVFLLTGMVFLNSYSATRALFGISTSAPSPEEVMDAAEKHYGFDQNILRKTQKKMNYPEVNIFFDKTSPKTGEKVTATALPKFFKNNNENLYYTWMLFRDEDDLNDDNAVEKAKIRAMGLVARGDFDPGLFGSDYSSSSEDPDKDGYEASFGGGDGRGGRHGDLFENGDNGFESEHYVEPVSKQMVDTNEISRCYRHNFGFSDPSSYDDSANNAVGEDLIVNCEHKFPELPKGEKFENPLNPDDELECECKKKNGDDCEIGDGEFTTAEELCWQLDPNNYDTDGDGYPDEADLAGLGQTQLTWTFKEGDRVGVVVEGTSLITINETLPANSSLNRMITFDCSGRPDEMYCVDDGKIGECVNQSCVASSCQQTQDDQTPCSTSSIDTGLCNMDNISGPSGFGTCEAVSDCTKSSSNGDLCEKDDIAGICHEEVCVLSQCGDEGEICQLDTGKTGICDSSKNCEDNNNTFNDPTTNPYYKITWSGIDVCDKEKVEKKDKRLLIKNDECEGTNDYGYTYQATKKVSLASEGLLKTDLSFTPENPQANKNNPEYSDYITVRANFLESNIEKDFVYYDWQVYYCNEDEAISDRCSDNQATDGDLDWDTKQKGIGVNQIKFRGSIPEDPAEESFYQREFFSGNNANEKKYFKVVLITKESANSEQQYISTVNIPVEKNDLDIALYKINFNGDTNLSTISATPICNNGDYKKICPVYTGQILVAVYQEDGSNSVESAYWEVNDVKMPVPFQNPFSSLTGDLGEHYTYFPITSSGMSLGKISFKALKGMEGDGKETITSERIFSAAEPIISRIKDNNENVWPQSFIDRTGESVNSEKIFFSKIGETGSLKAEIVPNYLENSLAENNLEIKWFLNNQEINQDFISNNPEYNFSFEAENQIINFDLPQENKQQFNLKAEISKIFNEEERAVLKENWGIREFKTLENSKTITLKQTNNLSPKEGGTVSKNSLNLFMASTYNNASEYFVFVIKTAIILVLFWSLVYGVNYWNNREYKLEK